MLALFCTDIRGAEEQRARQKPRSPQKGSAFGVSLLEEAVAAVWQIPLPELTPPGHGKPGFVNDTEHFFSISHSKTHVLVALSDAPVGCDVETHREISDASAGALMDETEREQFNFFELWCLREGLYKLNGAGNLREILRFRKEGEQIVFPESQVTGYLIPGIEGCSASVCQERPFELPELQWVPVEKLYREEK